MNPIKKLASFLFIIAIASCKTSAPVGSGNTSTYTQYVNPLIGTAPLTDPRILGYTLPDGWRSWAGLVFPGTSLPNAMVQLSPITEYGSGAGYEYEDSVIYGFTHTNKGHWNLCNIPLLPVSGVADTLSRYTSVFSHSQEKAAPGYYQVYLKDFDVNVRLTSSLRCGYHQYDYKNKADRRILFDLAHANNGIINWKIDQDGPTALQGFQETRGEKIFFYATLNSPIDRLDKQEEGSKKGKAVVYLKEGGNDPVEVKIAL